MREIVLFGAGTVGRYLVRELKSRGNTKLLFADNDERKWSTEIEGVRVLSPAGAQRELPSATWIACALHTPYPSEIKAEIQSMGVKSEPLANYLSIDRPQFDRQTFYSVINLCADRNSMEEMSAQDHFRLTGHTNYPHDNVEDVYFPDFIRKLENEVFIDCGAADGDTALEVIKRWDGRARIISFEPDHRNYAVFQDKGLPVELHWAAVSDYMGTTSFTSTGDQTAHIGGDGLRVPVIKLDEVVEKATFIKMDIEGSELDGLWGAKEIIRHHQPVLAICAYHLPDHIWQIPLLIHALNPHYKLYLRRYLEMPWEMVWYAVPPERVR